ncbi:MAG: exodeoxyribonuclease VII large subunit [Marinifilaceae bacterium]
MPQQGISLYELNNQIKCQLQNAFPSELWVVAEISEMHANRSGHCYLELIEKGTQTDQIIAKARATIWAYTYRMLKPFFETTTGQPFAPGIKILAKVSVEFQEVYGLSLNIKDIDPSYTLGDIARRRKETLDRLEKEGVVQMNKELELPILPKTIAIISSPTAAGYEDFTNQLENNPNGFKFHYKLFSAVMQGNQAEDSIINALDRIYDYEDIFEAVVIIRGGGSQADLNCFDSYLLASHAAQYPLPIISGIGHERDDTILDMVAHTRVKTPTAAAEFLIDCFAGYEDFILNLQEEFISGIKEILTESRERLEWATQKFSPLVQQILERQNNKLQLQEQRLHDLSKQFLNQKEHILEQKVASLKFGLKQRISNENHIQGQLLTQLKSRGQHFLNQQEHKLQLFEQTIKYVNPINILKKGYSLTLKNGKLVRDLAQLSLDDEIETHLASGKIISRVKSLENKKT